MPRAVLRSVLCAAAAASVLTSGAGPALAAPSPGTARSLAESPAGQVLVVYDNVKEAFEADRADPADMNNFVGRLVAQVPYAPDALILSEIRVESADTVVRLMEEATGDNYEVAGLPAEAVYQDDGSVRDSAVVVNADTMRAPHDGGEVIRSEFDPGLLAPGAAPRVKEHTYVLATERRGGLRVPMVGLHYALNSSFVDEAAAYRQKAVWNTQIAEVVEDEHRSRSRRQVPVIAGDFNARRCFTSGVPGVRDPVDCPVLSTAWTSMTRTLGYTDAVWDQHGASDEQIFPHFYRNSGIRIDFIFTKGEVVAAGSDVSYSLSTSPDFSACEQLYDTGRSELATGACRSDYYTDHRFTWAVVAAETGRPDAGR